MKADEKRRGWGTGVFALGMCVALVCGLFVAKSALAQGPGTEEGAWPPPGPAPPEFCRHSVSASSPRGIRNEPDAAR